MNTEKRQNAERCDSAQLIVGAKHVAIMLGISLRTVRSMDASGKLPLPVRIGGLVSWRKQELIDWVEAGCPDRETWNTRRAKLTK